MSRLKFSVALSPSAKIRLLGADDPVSFIPMEAIKDGLGGVDSSRAEPLGVMTAGSYNFVADGDVVLAKVTPCFENGKKGRAEGLVNGVGFATSEVYVLRPDASRIDPDFLLYILSSEDFRFEGIRSMTGAGGLKRVSAEAVRNYEVKISGFEDQTAIARFLDRETGLIDTLIEKKTRFIALLKEKRAAVITYAVTKGIDPDAPMKDTGVDWLGRVPAHWKVVPPTALFTESKERAREGDQMLSATQKYGVIPLAEYEALEQRQVTMAMVNLNMRKHVEVGDFVISMRSMDGGLERARAVGSVRSSYSVLKPRPDVEGRFYGALMKSSLYIQALRLTSNFIRDGQDLNFSHVRKVKLPEPGLREQAAIADHIEAETARINGLITLTERSIDLLREKRAAIITAAVTGKIDVRVAA